MASPTNPIVRSQAYDTLPDPAPLNPNEEIDVMDALDIDPDDIKSQQLKATDDKIKSGCTCVIL